MHTGFLIGQFSGVTLGYGGCCDSTFYASNPADDVKTQKHDL